MKKLCNNWLVIATALIIFGICFTTVCFNGKRILVKTDGISGFENEFGQNLYGRKYWVEVTGIFNLALDKKIIEDVEDRYTLYKMDNGQLTYNYIGYDMSKNAQKYIRFSNKMKEMDIPLLYVQVPFKINKYDNELPYGSADETNRMVDEFVDTVSPECKVFDLREEIHRNGMVHEDLFYKTDHHWTAEAGFWAASVVSARLKSDLFIDLDLSHVGTDNYTAQKYRNYMLGSQGKRTGIIYSGRDDFILFEPKYETNYKVTIPVKDLVREGPYSDTILFKKYMGHNYYKDDPGRVYTGDNYALMVIENLLSTNTTKLLLIKDSYSKSVIPSLASTCAELHVIDMRTYKGAVSQYAKENDIDCIVVMYNPSVALNSGFFALK